MTRLYYGLSIDVMDTNARIRHGSVHGLAVGRGLQPADIAEAIRRDDHDVVNVSVSDNGATGNGLAILFTTPLRKRPRQPKEADLLFACDFTIGQARLLASALMAAVEMRIAEARADQDDREIGELNDGIPRN